MLNSLRAMIMIFRGTLARNGLHVINLIFLTVTELLKTSLPCEFERINKVLFILKSSENL